MSHLNIRTSEQDEINISFLTTRWHLGRSDATRRALALAASTEETKPPISKKELLKKSKFIGSDPSSEITSTNYKEFLKTKLRKKYGC